LAEGPRPRPGIADLGIYPVGESTVEGVARVGNLASNENAVAPSAAVVAACRDAAAQTNRYPDVDYLHLRERIATTHGLEPARIVCTNGSSELITMLAAAYSGEGDEILMGLYGYLFFTTPACIAGAQPVRAPSPNLRFDIDAALAAVTPRTRILFLDNPNNPTGSCLSSQEVARLRAGLREDILLVLDGAYAEYVGNEGYEPGGRLVEAGDNTVMLRTFSKIHGLAGMRLGWGYAPPAVASVINRVRQPNNVSHIAQAAGIAALADRERVARLKAENARLRDGLRRDAASLGLETIASEANFVLVRFPDPARDAAAAYDYLKGRGIIARPMGAYGLDDCLRVTIGSAADMADAVAGLKAYLDS